MHQKQILILLETGDPNVQLFGLQFGTMMVFHATGQISMKLSKLAVEISAVSSKS
nr:hypothetical protein Iba_chr08aCG7450 [Ipomoea batatas]